MRCQRFLKGAGRQILFQLDRGLRTEPTILARINIASTQMTASYSRELGRRCPMAAIPARISHIWLDWKRDAENEGSASHGVELEPPGSCGKNTRRL